MPYQQNKLTQNSIPRKKKKTKKLQKIKMFSGKHMQKEIVASKLTQQNLLKVKIFRLKENI